MRSGSPANKGRVATHGNQNSHQSKDGRRSQDSRHKAGETRAVRGKEASRDRRSPSPPEDSPQSHSRGSPEEARPNRDAESRVRAARRGAGHNEEAGSRHGRRNGRPGDEHLEGRRSGAPERHWHS